MSRKPDNHIWSCKIFTLINVYRYVVYEIIIF